MTQYLTVDWSVFNPATITETQIEIGVNGLVFDNRIQKKPERGQSSVPIPVHDATKPHKV